MRPRFARALRVLLLLAVPAGLAAYFGGRHAWAEHQFRAAQRALEQRDLSRAQAHLERCLKVRADADVHLLAARTARLDQRYEDAERHLFECQRRGGGADSLKLEGALLVAQRGGLDPAVEGYLRGLTEQDHPAALLALEALAHGYLLSHRLGRAMDCLERWLQRQPDAVPALLLRGSLWDGIQQPGNAVKDYRRAVAARPDNEHARLRLAEALLATAQPAEALEHWLFLRQRRPDDPQVLVGLARCRREVGQADEARPLLDEVLARQPEFVPALRERGRLALDRQQPAEAESFLRPAASLAPFDYEVLYLLARALQQQGKKEAAVCLARLDDLEADLRRMQELQRAISKAPQDPALRYEVGALHLCHDHDEEGLRWLDGALREDPHHLPAQALLAEYRRAGKSTDAAFLRHTHAALGEHYQRLGLADAAARHRRLAQEHR